MLIEGAATHHLNEIYADKYISERISHDHWRASPINHPQVAYLTAIMNGTFCGVFLAIFTSQVETELHSLLKKSCVMHSRNLGKQALHWAFSSKPILRVSAKIIEGLDTVKNYCFKLGMKEEGFIRDACVQNGETKGVHIIGITKKEWESNNGICY